MLVSGWMSWAWDFIYYATISYWYLMSVVR